LSDIDMSEKKTETVSIRISETLLRKLRALAMADEPERSVSELIVTQLEAFVGREQRRYLHLSAAFKESERLHGQTVDDPARHG
jgi:predicted transcriptional regulator